jgi:FkbM family methyltransferase
MKKMIFDFFRLYPLTLRISETIKLIRKKKSDKQFVIKLFGKTDIKLRGNSSDFSVLESTFIDKHHRSPFSLGTNPVIVDLGSNIGLTLLDYYYEYPDARLLGVELDADNFKSLEFNTSKIKNCSIINAGVWKTNGEIEYNGADAQSFSINENNAGGNKKEAITIDSLFTRFNISKVDFLKMDIEGAEAQIFLESDFSKWLSCVNTISVEIHGSANLNSEKLFEEIRKCLENSGFHVFKSALHWSSLIGFKKK